MKFDEYDKSFNKKLDKNLDIKKFELDYYKNKKYNKVLHFALDSIIDIYNIISEENSKKEGIYFLKSKNVLLANITE